MKIGIGGGGAKICQGTPVVCQNRAVRTTSQEHLRAFRRVWSVPRELLVRARLLPSPSCTENGTLAVCSGLLDVAISCVAS